MALKPINQSDFTMTIIKDLGMKKPTEKYYKKVRMALFECLNCKTHFEAVVCTKSKTQKSCISCNGFENKKPNRDHKLYRVWADTKNKIAQGKDSSHYVSYGSKNITMCEQWYFSYDIFFDWAIKNGWKESLSIDRINNDKGYSPENCRWTDKSTQSSNQRVLRKSNTSGYKGVLVLSDKRHLAYIRFKNTKFNLGVYLTKLEAAKAYDSFVILLKWPHSLNLVLSEDEIVLPKNKKSLTYLQAQRHSTEQSVV